MTMVTRGQQKDNDRRVHPLLRQLNIFCGEKTSSGGNKTEETVNSFDLLTYLLNNGSVSEDIVRNAVQDIRGKQNTTKVDGIKITATSGGNPIETTKGEVSKRNSALVPTALNSSDNSRTRHIALRFFYDGAKYSGLAQNIGQENDNSVERCIFDALLKARLITSRETSNYSRCGRTDRGVSAAGQVVALHLKSAFPKNASSDENGTSLLEESDLPKNEYESKNVWTIPRPKKRGKSGKGKDETKGDSATTESRNRVNRDLKEYSYAKILNNILPLSIRILGWTPVTEDFSARFSAGSRTYRYFFCKRRMNMEAIGDGLNRLVGKHDFRNLCKMDVEKVYNFERLIHSAEVVQVEDQGGNGDVCYLKIVGQAFLWHQIRCIAEVIFMIGNEFESPSIISELLDVKKHPGKPSYSLADEKPLVLHDCMFPNLQFGYSIQNLWTVSCQLEKQWEDLTLAAARLRSGIESLHSCSVLKNDLTSFADLKLTEIRKKLQRRGIRRPPDLHIQGTDDVSALRAITSWADALSWLEKRNIVPSPSGLTNTVHVPLMQRSMGPSYEEKVANLQKSEKRRMKYEENIIKKRKTAEEDKAFYDHKIKQGGTGI
ncbi:unnamed protein product [Pseudo-nitzschia multistriata]|uniref:Pseudouridine synthase I TruA alpha/beta domain-containing protein n=1 Tax=Pseudo-nitzschia multistriata TaxID=183589 RepID=A0A448ZD79_9STRA|nr:unnamed protein product [Pseudo-nitzschia multistriata]